jgi:hypothetical protein
MGGGGGPDGPGSVLLCYYGDGKGGYKPATPTALVASVVVHQRCLVRHLAHIMANFGIIDGISLQVEPFDYRVTLVKVMKEQVWS